MCARLDLDLIADEIYANCAYAGPPFVSALNLPAGVLDPGRIHVIWGLAKDFGLPGLKVGVLHTRHPELRAAAREFAYFAPVSTDTQALLRDLLSDPDWLGGFRTANQARLAASYAFAADLLAAAGIPFLAAEAGFSIWTDLGRWIGDDSFVAERALWRRLFDDGRVSILPGEVFHSPRPGWFRLCHHGSGHRTGGDHPDPPGHRRLTTRDHHRPAGYRPLACGWSAAAIAAAMISKPSLASASVSTSGGPIRITLP